MDGQAVRQLNRQPERHGRYVLYWMQAAQRAHYNHALEYAIDRANERKKPVLVAFGLTPTFPQANARHYRFMLEGLAAVQQDLRARGIQMAVRMDSPPRCAVELARDACLAVVDAGHLRIQRQWRDEAAEHIACRLDEVETNLIVPVEEAAQAENFSAGTFRPRIMRKLPDYLVNLRHRKPRTDSLGIRADSLDFGDIGRLIKTLGVDCSVPAAKGFPGGTRQARRRLDRFVKNGLDDYPERRNDPATDGQSGLSPYLHFGQISPLYVALTVRNALSRGGPAFLEELIVRRELSHNFVHYNRRYDSFEALPPWVRRTLEYHGSDKRDYVYSLQEFEHARTHDPYWNAAQKEMVLTGKMHGYMRMYWGKKILEWTESPREGLRIALHLNNKYELDGRDPNGFSGVAWCFGKHDRAWAERPVFGKIRYMNAAGLRRKFRPDAYVQRIGQLEAASG